jgi:hypothetical protein
MWGILIKLGSRYAFFRRWRNTLIGCGIAALCVVTALLYDAKMYLSAGIFGLLAAAALFTFVVQYFYGRRVKREIERRKIEEAERRAAALAIRREKVGRAKESIVGAARGLGDSAVGMAGIARTGFSGARERFGAWRRKE